MCWLSLRENKISDVLCGVLFYCLIKFNQKILILSRFVTKNDFSYVIMTTELCIKYFLSEVPLPRCSPVLLHREEVSSPKKTINIKQYLSTSHFLVDNRYVVIKSSQTKQLYITKVFDTQFSCHDYIRKIIWR
jgi:hypothetical protein